jgi:uncharacterized protein YpmB
MKTTFQSIKLILAIVLFNTYMANAQKLPNVQKASVYAPHDISINGKSSEWHDTFQAYNKAAEIFYTISNDDKNVYLTVKAKEREVVDKIIRGGITFTINRETNKNAKNNLSVTYPVLEGTDMWEVAGKFGNLSNAYKDHEPININQLNDLFSTKEKLITVNRIEEIQNQSISIYNTEGIKASSLFDEKLNYTYELALPVAYLKLAGSSKDAFNYQVMINAEPEIKRPAVITSSTPPPPPPISNGALGATYFRGTYTLAKKP